MSNFTVKTSPCTARNKRPLVVEKCWPGRPRKKPRPDKMMIGGSCGMMMWRTLGAVLSECGSHESSVEITLLISPAKSPFAQKSFKQPIWQRESLWVLEMKRDLHLPVSVMQGKEKARQLIQPQVPSFKASDEWAYKFFHRNRFTLRVKTSLHKHFLQDSKGRWNRTYRRYTKKKKWLQNAESQLSQEA